MQTLDQPDASPAESQAANHSYRRVYIRREYERPDNGQPGPYYVAREYVRPGAVGVWISYGAVADQPDNLTPGRYLFHGVDVLREYLDRANRYVVELRA